MVALTVAKAAGWAEDRVKLHQDSLRDQLTEIYNAMSAFEDALDGHRETVKSRNQPMNTKVLDASLAGGGGIAGHVLMRVLPVAFPPAVVPVGTATGLLGVGKVATGVVNSRRRRALKEHDAFTMRRYELQEAREQTVESLLVGTERLAPASALNPVIERTMAFVVHLDDNGSVEEVYEVEAV
ncbi:hypothetical protein CTI14_20000 [Methylobacterium radiotolerans]|nr:hypothetical protein CTI14_20000 [Methylobacterium radiotolerans]